MSNIEDFGKYRDQRDAYFYRLYLAEALLELYRRQNGRDATDMEELEQWRRDTDLSAYGQPIDPNKVFSPEQAKQVLERINN